jgi:hypothetical protein
MSRQGSKVAFISDPPQEGFEAVVIIDNAPYRIRLIGICKAPPVVRKRRVRGGNIISRETSQGFRDDFRRSEERRIWRVLYYHLKSIFETADSGVKELRELMLAYIVLPNNKTMAEHLIPQLGKIMAGRTDRLLPAMTESEV